MAAKVVLSTDWPLVAEKCNNNIVPESAMTNNNKIDIQLNNELILELIVLDFQWQFWKT